MGFRGVVGHGSCRRVCYAAVFNFIHKGLNGTGMAIVLMGFVAILCAMCNAEAARNQIDCKAKPGGKLCMA